jgi:1-aminocyclopropane-1-carboxylate deaminase/D-cysteine desulfhydrase-like pyridoxal-dependent ACC family enzyme
VHRVFHRQIIELDSKLDFRSIVDWSENGALESETPEFLRRCEGSLEGSEICWVRQGGANAEAAEGVEELGEEMEDLICSSSLPGPWKVGDSLVCVAASSQLAAASVQVIVASGTGTTAYFLNRYFRSRRAVEQRGGSVFPKTPPVDRATAAMDVEILAVPCVGSSAHLKAQMKQLHALCGGDEYTGPTILSTEYAPRRVFAKPYAAHLAIWQALQQETAIEFDLIYAPRTFEILLSHTEHVDRKKQKGANEAGSLKDWMPGANVLYYHCGGVEGNESQFLRYRKVTVAKGQS